jgi:hypothetical protein
VKKKNLPKILVFVLVLSSLMAVTAYGDPPPAPNLILESDITVQVEPVTTMPFVLGPTFVQGAVAQNLGSPVSIKNKLYLIDQNDAIYRLNGRRSIQRIFSVDDAPDGLMLDNRQSILNISRGRRVNSIYVMLTSGSEPTTSIPIYRLPDPLPGECCLPGNPIPLPDLYRIGPLPGPLGFFVPTRTEFQVLYEYKLAGDTLEEPRAIAAFETQSGPTHNGGGMLTLPDGRVLFATGDALPFGAEGRAAPQDPTEFVSKLLIIDPDDGSVEVAAQGIRNVQRLEFAGDSNSEVRFGDIGGVTAEEVNVVAVADLLDTSVIENFGWGRNADGNAREGTFYVGPGLPLVSNTEPPVLAFAPSPEAGFIQPHAQYGRNDPNGGVAVSGPVTSGVSFLSITTLFSDRASGRLYATEADIGVTNVPVLKVNLIDENGAPLGSLQDLAGGRADPRLFTFPDGSAGVLLEATGTFYRLTEVGSN